MKDLKENTIGHGECVNTYIVYGKCQSCGDGFKVEYQAKDPESIDIYFGGHEVKSCGCRNEDRSDYNVSEK